jgi:hypothetical protein
MKAVLMLAAVSALAGRALGIYSCRWGALALSGLILVVVAAIVLQNQSFGFFAGVAITVGYVSLNQIAYLFGAAVGFDSGSCDRA